MHECIDYFVAPWNRDGLQEFQRAVFFGGARGGQSLAPPHKTMDQKKWQIVNSVMTADVLRAKSMCLVATWNNARFAALISCLCSENKKQKLDAKRRVPFILYPVMCAKCGTLWPEMFMVSGTEWNRYIEKSRRDEVICRPCYDQIKIWIDGSRLP